MRKITLILFFFSGATGLIYEVIWTRLFAQLFGNTVFATSTVLAVFMAGLGAGAFFLGKWLDARKDALRQYGFFEAAIGLFSLLIPPALQAVDPLISATLARVQGSPVLQAPLLLSISALFLFWPTFFMGGTLPALSKFYTRSQSVPGADIGVLYSLNTFGAMLGAFSAGFLLIAQMGLTPSNMITAIVNISLGAAAILLAHHWPAGTPADAKPAQARAPAAHAAPQISGRTVWLVLGVYAVSGFAALAAEVVWARVLVFFLGNSTYAFSTMLSTFLGGLAAGSYAGSRLARRAGSSLRQFALLEWTVALVILGTIPLLWRGFYSAPFAALYADPSLPWTAYLAIKFAAAGAVLFVPALLFGACFALVCNLTIHGLARLGRGVGTVYAFNTAGAILGSLLAGFVLIPAIGLQWSLAALAWLCSAAGLILLLRTPALARRTRLAFAIATAGVLLGSLIFLPIRLRLHTAAAGTAQEKELFYTEDHTATVRVYEQPNGDRFVSVDGHFIGATAHESDKKQKLLAHLPLLLNPEVQSAITIGLGSGITLGALARHPQLESIEAVEIAPGVRSAARFFRDANGAVLDNPRVHLLIGDGINYLKTTRESYDIIVSDAKLNPEFAGNALVYSREYYARSRDRLRPGGIFCQWVPLYLPPDILKTVLRTFCDVFPAVDLWFFPQQHILLTGRHKATPFDGTALRQGLAEPPVRQHLQPFHLANAYILASARLAGRAQVLAFAGSGPLNTFEHAVIEFDAVRAFRSQLRAEVEQQNLRALTALSLLTGTRFTHLDADSLALYRQSMLIVLNGLAAARRMDLLSYGREAFESALVLNPHEGRARELLELLGREAEAITSGAAAGKRPAELVRRINFYYEQNKLAEAGRLANELLQARPGSAEGLNLQGLIFQRQGRLADARKAFEAAHTAAPENEDIILNLATLLEKSGDFARALTLFQEAEKRNPRSPEIHNNLGILLARQGQIELAIAQYRQALTIDPLFADAQNNIGIAYGRQGNQAAALHAFEAVLKIHPAHTGALKNAGVTYLLQKRYASAITVLQKVVAQNENDVDSWINLGLAHAQAGQMRAARQCWQKALALDPTAEEARKNLQILMKAGH